jgi:hypothetical protein
LAQHVVGEGDRLLEPADQHGRQTHERDDLTDRRQTLHHEPDAGHQNGDQSDGRTRPGRDRGQRPPGQDRHLRVEHPVDQPRKRRRLLVRSREALDRGHVAQHVRHPLGEIIAEDVGLALHHLGAAQDDVHQKPENNDQHHKDCPQSPVDDKRRRQKHDERDERREMFAEEGQPHAEHARSAFDHDLEQPPCVGSRVEAHRQMQHVVEKGGHLDDATAVSEPVGVQRDGHPGDDAKNAEPGPGGKPRPDCGPSQRCARP